MMHLLFFRFRHFDNKYFKHWFIRDAHDKGYSSRKLFETVSRLNLQDAMNIVKESSSVPALYLHQNNNNNNIASSKSFSSLFRSYTQTSFSPSDSNENSFTKRIPGLPMDPAENTTFNFDVGNIEYNPSTKDLDAVEMHHILSDDIFKPVKRVILIP